MSKRTYTHKSREENRVVSCLLQGEWTNMQACCCCCCCVRVVSRSTDVAHGLTVAWSMNTDNYYSARLPARQTWPAAPPAGIRGIVAWRMMTGRDVSESCVHVFLGNSRIYISLTTGWRYQNSRTCKRCIEGCCWCIVSLTVSQTVISLAIRLFGLLLYHSFFLIVF